MTKSTIARERLQEIAEDGFLKHGESKVLARMALAAMDSEPVILYRQVNPTNGMKTYWAELDPEEFRHLKKYTDENAEFMTLYRHAQQPVVEREPIAWLNDAYLARGVVDGEAGSEDAGPGYIPVYREAGPQPAPVVPDDVLEALQKVARIRLDLNDFDGVRRGIADCLCDAEEALIEVVNRRAAMVQELKKSAGTEAICRSNENVQVLHTISPAQSDCCPEQNGVDPEQNNVTPAQDGNYLVIPDGYVMVPKEPTKEMIDAGWLHFMGTKNPSSKGTYKAMLAAAPQEEKIERKK
ncbi:hypothetical protein NY635_28140 [Klebsiella pneumoniae]|uniref:hypothetical protein n=1 Tax=Klebsiella TaxID=570 RepID=UPI001251E15E|nr:MULTISPECIES: hypothetical protein [Klebsiella]MDC6731923.1 hypothetical protein [Klebsiella pneumoniae]MDR4714481.1 hypothetical protein [Klebsiella pneumoniae]BBK11071.1 hypothetical protein TMSI_14630 [Klebsiella quasipneumoniae]